ncbi:hypothetical protein IAE22_33050, partial [Bacillus sp. S34]|nr:hypothetical protein [Bacillus sp. S34]
GWLARRNWDRHVGRATAAMLLASAIPFVTGLPYLAVALGTLGAPNDLQSVLAAGGLTETGVDAFSTLVLGHGVGKQSTVTTSMLTNTPTRASISGSDARIEFDSFFYTPSS